MYVFKISVQKINKPLQVDSYRSFLSLITNYYKNGQIYKNFDLMEDDEAYFSFVLCPEKTSLDQANNNFYVNKYLSNLEIENDTGINIQFKGINRLYKEKECCNNVEYLILYTNMFYEQSPLRCGNCFSPYPLYKIPKDLNKDYTDILTWTDNYKACDTLYINSDAGEDFGLIEISNYNSDLTKQGLELCNKIETQTGLKTYYYLFNHQNNIKNCPGCGKEWFLETPLFTIFNFKCDSCLLLSSLDSEIT